MKRERPAADKFSSLPKHIVDDIFFKLPARSLFRFRFLSRYYLNLIQSPEFITAHARDSCRNRAGLLVLAESRSEKVASFLPPESFTGHVKGSSDFPLPFLKGHAGGKPLLRYAGSFNGLVCLIVHRPRGEYWVLWNPATSQFSFAPPPILFQNPCSCIPRGCPEAVIVGFGYDHEADDYKSVRVCGWNDGRVEVEILTWAKRYWTKIQGKSFHTIHTYRNQQGHVSFLDSPVTAKGRVHWMEASSGMVLSFKLHDESLEWISTTPDSSPSSSSIKRTICGWKGSLAMLVQPLQEDSFLSVWLFDEGESSSWSSLLTIPTHGLPRQAEAVWGVDGSSLLALYVKCIACDSRGGRFELPFDSISRAFEFAQTLLPIPGCS